MRWFFYFLLTWPLTSVASTDIVLLKVYNGSQAVTGWLMSEKLDGMRATWNGHQLISRGGKLIHAPHWFIKDFPPFSVDGELWTRRHDFEGLVSIVRDQIPTEQWQSVTFNVFEVPNQPGGLLARLHVLKQYLQTHPSAYLKIILQQVCQNKSHLQTFLKSVVAQQGEGVVLRNPHSAYEVGRTGNALKVKPYEDAECTVTGYQAGKGKYSGQVGALLCQMKNGLQLKLGSGLTNALRADPPKLGRSITFKYYGYTKNQKPRHPVFLRIRQDKLISNLP